VVEIWEEELVRDVSRATAEIYECPHCHYRFSLFQSRGIACAGCKEAVFNCPRLRCPRCDYEFPISNKYNNVKNEIFLRKISAFIKKDMKNFGDRFG
jgi:DNA-directed RNA polymerase subunit M/transcription elongation factor TFIIS